MNKTDSDPGTMLIRYANVANRREPGRVTIF